ncbi:MAG TPA: SPOR domain-containing protein [Thiolinea sp.]|nr:SPOR domain-containing protein [Thiolinea sp.]
MMNLLVILLVFLNLSLLALNLGLVDKLGNVPLTEPGIASLELVHEVPPARYSSGQGVDSSCYTIGPYNSERAAQQVMVRIRNYGLDVQMRSLRTMETLSYLVYIPAQPGEAEVERITRDLARYDVPDYMVIREGPYQNAISLGFFEDLQKAKRHTEYIRYLGYDARYTEQKAAREVFWLDYDEPFGSNTPVLEWSRAVDSASRLQLIPRACR